MPFGPNTKTTIGAACGCAVFLGGVAWGGATYLGGKFDAMNKTVSDKFASADKSIQDLNTEMQSKFAFADKTIRELNSGLDTVKSDRFTMTAASEHALRTAIENPGMRIPDPRDPSKVFVVDVGRRTGQPSEPHP